MSACVALFSLSLAGVISAGLQEWGTRKEQRSPREQQLRRTYEHLWSFLVDQNMKMLGTEVSVEHASDIVGETSGYKKNRKGKISQFPRLNPW